MNKRWLFLRGELDENNRKNILADTDMWYQLFQELSKDDKMELWFKHNVPMHNRYDYIFARGGFDYYNPILKQFPKAYKIYYGAGKRIVPDGKIKYNLVLVDTEVQKQKVIDKFPMAHVETWFKPAANHFKPMPEVEKKYDVCYVANCHSKFQERIKRVKWVYKTAPKDLKILHLGKSSRKPPSNIKVKQATLKEMPKYINQCKAMIVPYKEYDSAPRVITESINCGVRPYVMNGVNTNSCLTFKKENIWKAIRVKHFVQMIEPVGVDFTAECINNLIGG